MTEETIGPLFGFHPDERDSSPDDSLVDSDVYIGVELELEEVSGLAPFQKYLSAHNWRWYHDHSLRGDSCELITQVNGLPIKGRDVLVALEALDSAVAKIKNGKHPVTSARTSTHIHIDCSDLTPSQLSNFILYYTLVEDTIIRAEAPERSSNNYCLPISASNDLRGYIARLTADNWDIGTINHVAHGWPKYSAFNVGSLRNLGTIEFRVFPGCYDGATILRWINIVMSLRRVAKNPLFSPGDIPEAISGDGYDIVIDKIFPAEIAERLKASLEPRDMLRGARLVQSILLDQYQFRYPSRGLNRALENASDAFIKFKKGEA